eukprot:5976502-Prymnesium_polylepis.1
MTASWSSLPRHEPEVRTIAHYKREYAVLTAGAVIAASSEYVGYALRGVAHAGAQRTPPPPPAPAPSPPRQVPHGRRASTAARAAHRPDHVTLRARA